MKDGLLRSHKMARAPRPSVRFEAFPWAASSEHPCPLCPAHLPMGERWGSFSFDGGQTWFCNRHKPEQRP